MSAVELLALTDVTKRFGGRPVLRGIVLDVAAGETVAIVGPSGSGKSTLLNIIGALDTPDSGTVRLDDTDVRALCGSDLAAYRASEVGFVFQEHHLLPQLSALENVLLPTLSKAATRARARQSNGMPRVQDWAIDLMDRLGVGGRRDAFPAQLSGGERQRVAVARALINCPRILLCDEPTGNLDAENGAGVVALLAEAAGRQNVAVLMVTHNMEHAGRFDRCVRIRDGYLETEMSGRQP